jgi:uncharacterized protein (TIGR02145 family)
MKNKNKIWFGTLMTMAFILIFINSCTKTDEKPTAVTDIDGNSYDTVIIGTQVWMVENLKTTKYNDGTSISLVTDSSAWSNLSTPGYCWYDNNPISYKAAYGALYNWHTVNTGKLCPSGWHVPTDAEWTTLTDYLINNGYGYQGSGYDIAKSLAAQSVWETFEDENIGTVGYEQIYNNSSGFNDLPGGYRDYFDGSFYYIGYYGFWWSSTETSATNAYYREIGYGDSEVSRYFNNKKIGYSVRCLRD